MIWSVESSLGIALDTYGLVAVTASSSTIDELLEEVRADNKRRQRGIDETGRLPYRQLNVSHL